MEIQFISMFPTKKSGGYWELSLIPNIDIARNPQEGLAIGLGWLFWTIAIYVDYES